jgi:hypothetical protein
MKIRPVGAELFHSDGQTEMTKVMIVLSNFANASKSHSRNTLWALHVNGYVL